MSLSFEQAAELVRNFSTSPSNSELQELYGLYKQATVGDCTESKPGLLSGPTARGKWDGWNSKLGLDTETAKEHTNTTTTTHVSLLRTSRRTRQKLQHLSIKL
eukprot:TRINITY_DN392_c0_g1_i1.p1 TRINITY_DN392_c0_g1~~TRINITY_DN392_c0_g1_i1.p1  ORF type:complete len:103 (-),score=19.98 TRINITY_DN392_c0_g1_i1:227-535(-)